MSATDPRLNGVDGPIVYPNPSPSLLYEHALIHESGSRLADTGALIATSGVKTGRSPGDKRLVREPDTEADIWWGPVNQSLAPSAFTALRTQALNHLNTRSQVYVIDGFAGADPACQVRIRVICERPYHALFMRNMLIMPEEIGEPAFAVPDYTLLNAGRCDADTRIDGVETTTSVALSLEQRELVILGTEYAGEMKKGVFTLMNYLMPKQGVLSMHCSANAGPAGDVSLFFGLSGTGKTTLSADPDRALIGDDEHCWSDAGIANIEGGCYAKVIDLSAAAEPQIHSAIRFGAVLENVCSDPATGAVDYADSSLTENTRCAYPVRHIENARIPGRGEAPDHVIFLTCDAFSVLPPVSRLTPDQAMYHFISGYTAKVAGTEMGVTEPQATFSACFGAPFLVWHPAVYAQMLAERIQRHGTAVWMVNTGWTGGSFGVGQRMPLAQTRAIIRAIHHGDLEAVDYRTEPVFGLAVPRSVPGVPDALLDPVLGWPDPSEYQQAALDLADRFSKNFEAYRAVASQSVAAAGPAEPAAIRTALAAYTATPA